MTYVISTSGLSKIAGGKAIVSEVNLHVKKGEIYGFLGPNGAGKTSVMKMLTGLWKPTGGDIELFGERLTSSSFEALKRLGSLIEYPIFYEKLTARENLKLHCEYMGYHDSRAIDEALALVGLTDAAAKAVKSFSLGMKQRLGLARAIATRPELLILDEPINGLDPIGIKDMRSLFAMLSREYGMTLFLSSHLLGELEQVADTIGVIREGKLVREVAMSNIREKGMEHIELTTNDTWKAAGVLDDKLDIRNFKVMSESTIRIYDFRLPQSDIVKALVLNGVNIEEIGRKRHSLEDYFFSLMERGDGA
ncbi:ABC transporter ATP-binding protein [Cohnella herbarum]|uniref:ABC transporter ATP-binding protein n=1 Tax=Cohnella herbarum TaxID=2728023 RepID=A0A7Z2ZPS4_9BACL|nr:ABC transporter ATP-binding protein [Cohnella herbarum]QJD87215.1 ABC transporter ATP-binding protein [Cohnella herbarum]